MAGAKKLKIGFVGVGGVAKWAHLGHLSTWEDVELAAFCDVSEEAAGKAAKQYGGQAFTDTKTMLDTVALDAAYVCVPPFAHTNQELLIAERGIGLFVEKPLATTNAKALEIDAAVRKHGIVAAVGYNWRSTAITKEARARMAGKKISAAYAFWVGGFPGAMWWRQQAQSGGQMNEQATHVVDIARHLIGGKAVSVYAAGAKGIGSKKWEKHDIHDNVIATVTFDNGAVLCAGTGHIAQGYRTGVDFLLEDLIVTHNNGELIVKTPEREEKIKNTNQAYQEEDRAFLEAVRKKDPQGVYCTYADAAVTHEICMAVNTSLETGKVVAL
ncbi:MAG: hypothetical protein AMXMBFR7_12640 [Planctomycetota bacterium]